MLLSHELNRKCVDKPMVSCDSKKFVEGLFAKPGRIVWGFTFAGWPSAQPTYVRVAVSSALGASRSSTGGFVGKYCSLTRQPSCEQRTISNQSKHTLAHKMASLFEQPRNSGTLCKFWIPSNCNSVTNPSSSRRAKDYRPRYPRSKRTCNHSDRKCNQELLRPVRAG